MTLEIGLFEAKTHLSELVGRVAEGGEEIVITRRGKPVARLTGLTTGSAVEEALADLLAARDASTPGAGSLRDLIDDGRRR